MSPFFETTRRIEPPPLVQPKDYAPDEREEDTEPVALWTRDDLAVAAILVFVLIAIFFGWGK